MAERGGVVLTSNRNVHPSFLITSLPRSFPLSLSSPFLQRRCRVVEQSEADKQVRVVSGLGVGRPLFR